MKRDRVAADPAATAQTLLEMTGSHWVPVSFHDSKPAGVKVSSPVPFCAAAARASAWPSLLKVSAIPCAGARYALGAGGEEPPPLSNFLPPALRRLADGAGPVRGAPRLPAAPVYIGFGLEGRPAALYMSFMLVEYANRVAQFCSVLRGKNLNLRLSGGMSFCSEGAAAALTSGRASISLGCPKAVKTAGLQGQVCVCLPAAVAEKFAAAWLRSAAPAGAGA